jgi:hypothetical protein
LAAGAKFVFGWIHGCDSATDEKSSIAFSTVIIAGMSADQCFGAKA